MKIYESAVRKPISTILLFVGVMVFGLFSLMNLAVDQYPEIEIPQISVITMYPGANAADIETNITRVLEDNLNTVSNLKKLTSKSQDNVSMITVEFEYGSDLNEGANEIRDVVSRVQSQLPDDIDYPTIFKFSTSMIPVMMLAVTAEESYPALNKILDDKLVNVLNRVDGVGAVSIIGAPEREVQVNVDPAKLEAYNLTVEQLGQIIAAENVNIPSGTIDVGNNTFNIKADGEFKLSDEMRKVVVSNAGGRTVRLSDVAQIRDTLEKATMDERVNGQRGVRVMFQKQSGANTVNIVHEIQSRLPEIQKTLPKDVKMELIFEGSQEITDAIGSLSETILYAFIFVVLVVMAFLGRWRATLIICMTIPVSLICSFIYLFATGSTLNIISLSSLSIAIGMVVDDAIVVLENITTHIERGSNPKEAAIYATNEVWLSVIATTLVVVAVFLPLTMVPGMAGLPFPRLGRVVGGGRVTGRVPPCEGLDVLVPGRIFEPVFGRVIVPGRVVVVFGRVVPVGRLIPEVLGRVVPGRLIVPVELPGRVVVPVPGRKELLVPGRNALPVPGRVLFGRFNPLLLLGRFPFGRMPLTPPPNPGRCPAQ